ncbi:glycosyltransferase 87 family protein [Kineosporia succinea]|uniref:Alpha-1,2-mannosyltransferase n=1 Tax=Kineosporia succinea TaxID=84632 RepID=A0ABT9P9Q4_9ACTN|nr:alpha-1,2-mannosyltransferase [Kineosporia succinea]
MAKRFSQECFQGLRTRRGADGGRLAHTVLGFQVLAVIVFTLCWNPLDFFIYRAGGSAIQEGAALYLERQGGLFFTYTPFAALSFAPLSWLPLVPARVLWNVASVAAFALAGREMLRLVGVRFTLWIVVGGLMLEPVWHTLFLGQINLFLLALVLHDLRRAAEGRSAGSAVGIGVGVATAIKLTPGVFVVLLLFAGKVRAAVTAAITFAVCTALGALASPGASWLYWREIFYDTTRVGVPGRRGDWPGAVAATGVTSLVVSPISWSHHWVWALPALVVLARSASWLCRLLLGASVSVFVLSPMWWVPREVSPFVTNAYLVTGLGLLTWLAWRSRQEGELAAGVPAHQHLERGRGLVERERPGDRYLEPPGTGEVDERLPHTIPEVLALRGVPTDREKPVPLGAGPGGDGDDTAPVLHQSQ